MSNLQTYYHFKLDLKKSGPTYRVQVVNPRHQTPQGQSVAKPGWDSPVEYPSRECKHDIKSKSKSKKTLFNVGQCKQCNISSHLKWVLVADKSMHMIIYNKIHIK